MTLTEISKNLQQKNVTGNSLYRHYQEAFKRVVFTFLTALNVLQNLWKGSLRAKLVKQSRAL